LNEQMAYDWTLVHATFEYRCMRCGNKYSTARVPRGKQIFYCGACIAKMPLWMLDLGNLVIQNGTHKLEGTQWLWMKNAR